MKLIKVQDINNVRNRYRRARDAWMAYGWAPRCTFREFAQYYSRETYSAFEGAANRCVFFGVRS